MKWPVLFLVAALMPALTWALPEDAPAQNWPNARAAIASRRFLLGTWHCTFTVGAERGEYTTTWTSVLDGLWLKQTWDQPQQPGTTFAFQAEYLVGFDERRQEWIRFGAMSTGQYFAIRMADTGTGGWRWTYVSFFGRRQSAPASGYDATFTRNNDGLYTVDGPTYPNQSGVTVTEHHVCRKA